MKNGCSPSIQEALDFVLSIRIKKRKTQNNNADLNKEKIQ